MKTSLSSRLLALILGIFAYLNVAAGNAVPQQSLGSINGTVKDSSGGVISGASVKVRNIATNLEQDSRSKSDGSYRFVDLPIGTYVVTISKDGFQTEEHSQILVRGNLTTTVDAGLQPGAVTSTVTVNGTPLLNETDTTNGYTLSEQEIASAPLGTGSFTQLAILAPGVNSDLLAGSGTNAGLGNQNIFANGQRDTSNTFTFNSVDANNLFNGLSSSSIGESRFVLNTNEQFLAGGQIQTNTSVFDAIGQGLPAPPPETIEEIHVNTSMYDVSQGASSGAHVSVATKSGTNDFHGSAYEYHQTDAWNANQFFLNAASIPRPPLHRNTFGATLGGPVMKNKLFFFGSYQGQRVSDATNGSTQFANVPTGLTDDRSAATLAALAGVPVTSVDNVALAILQAKGKNGKLIVPSATITDPNLIQSLGGNAQESGPPATFSADQANGNIDYIFSAKDRLAGKYYFQNDPSTSPFAVSQVLGFPQSLHAGSQVVSIDNTLSLTPNSTWEQRIGFLRQFANASTTQILTPTDINLNLLGNPNFPGFTITNGGSGNFNSLRIGPANNFANAGVFQNHFQVATNYNWSVGRHAISFGFNGDYGQLNVLNRENQVATFTFRNFTNFLTGKLGGRNGGGQLLNGETNRYFRAKQTGLFVQDSFKLKSNLTITGGLRWDWDGPLNEKNGLLTNFYAKNYSYDLASDTINNIGLVIAGNNKQFCGTKSVFCSNNSSTLTGRQWILEPRIGVAWSPQFVKNLVVRAGYGLYADRGEFFTEFSPSAGLGISGPFGVTTEQPFTVPFPTSCTGTGCLSQNPFGTTAPPPPPKDLSGVAALVHNQAGLSGCAAPVTPTCSPTGNPLFAFLFGGYDPRNTLPYSENWSLDVQWQPRDTLVIDIGYVGNHGQHELLPIPFNQPGIATPTNPINGQIYSYGFQATDADGGGGTLLTEQVGTTIAEFSGADGNTALRVPFIGYNPNSDFWEAEGISNYHALLVGVKKRLSRGLTANASYTWSHALDEGSGLSEGLFFNGNNPLNPRSAYGSSSFDRTHVFTVSYTYQFPNLVKSHSFMKHVANGWGVTGITIAESGQPYSVYDFSGTVASQFFGAGDDFITNPLLAIPGGTAKSVQLQGTTGVNANNPVLNASAFGITVNAPGTNGVPPCGPTTDESTAAAACDFSETGFSSQGRNTFRGPFQLRFDFGVVKTWKITERFSLRYDAQFFNIFNHASFDAPNNNISLNPCFGPNTQTSPANGCQWLGTIPATAGLTSPIADGLHNANQAAPFGSGIIQGTLGSPRFIQMALHLTF
ncbi:MAG TPA: TonB-dependent receptor [Candidatus Dormibacteraeota bacterium]|nr:TonB-dependent receptor [Candidatus Dormibacteraeota bacterium]